MEPHRPTTDAKTVDYFDRLTPEYHHGRMDEVIEVLSHHAKASDTLVDIGCGSGNILERICKETCIGRVSGIDVSVRSLERTRRRLECATYHGSILDGDFVESIRERFDFVLLGAVLHHLIGTSRRGSRRLAETALSRSLALLKPGGLLLIFEPVLSPKLAMDLLFYLKKLVTVVTNDRVPVFGYWNNIGAPVVSYYRTDDLVQMVKRTAEGELVERLVRDSARSRLLRLARIVRSDATLVVRKRDVGGQESGSPP